MKISLLLMLTVVSALGAALSLSDRSARADDGPPASLAASINLSSAHVLPDNPALVRAFIPTRSKSVKCLLSQNDTTLVLSGTQTFCAVRESSTYGSGVLITIDYSQAVPPGYQTTLTVWQEGARIYGPPIPCETPEAGGAC